MKKVVILAAGPPHVGSNPSLWRSIGELSVLEWQRNSLKSISKDIDVVIGFKADEQIKPKNPCIHLIKNEEWSITKSAGSLLCVDIDGVTELWVTYGDVLFSDQIILKMNSLNAQCVVAYDGDWRTRYIGRDALDINEAEKIVVVNNAIHRLGTGIMLDWDCSEFVGVVCLRGQALDVLRSIKNVHESFIKTLTLPDLLELIRLKGVVIKGVDVRGQWAELNEARDLAHFVMGTKAETLSRLRPMVKISTIQDQVSFKISEWKNQQTNIIRSVKNKLKGDSLIVRSSALSEDEFTHSNAGAYTSLLNINKDEVSIKKAVNAVISSYDNYLEDDQVLIQPMLVDVVMSGVIFSRTLELSAPYIVINYDDSGSTEGITSGKVKKNSVFYFFKEANLESIACSKIKKLILAVQEIESLLNYDALDIEFAIDSKEGVHVFQVRPLALQRRIPENLDKLIAEKLQQSAALFGELEKPAGTIVGSKSIYGNMPDWNVAEIIGTNPGDLAYSLYRYLILDEVWAKQRAMYGYRDVQPQGLLKRFAGKPYIDVRSSLNSFLPQGLPDELAARLVDFYSTWLIKNPHLHDKVEFEVIPTCVGHNFKRWERRLREDGNFTIQEIELVRRKLLEITNKAIDRVESDLDTVQCLADRLNNELSTQNVTLYEIKALLDDCKRFGTLPFAHLARAGFIAVTFLREAVSTGLISKRAMGDFLAGIRTVSHTLSEDAYQVKSGGMEMNTFIKKYGHLRPGTYDITSQAYHEDPKRFLVSMVDCAQIPSHLHISSIWDKEKSNFFNQLQISGLQASGERIEVFMRLAIEGREKAKFIFTRSLSIALDGLISWGKKNDLSREILAEFSIMRLLEYIDQPNLTEAQIKDLTSQAHFKKAEREISLSCKLPPLISSQQDFYSFTLNEAHPNFIGLTKVCSTVVDSLNLDNGTNLAGKIILIPQADPGYDWLFDQGIAGLITMYGGANSHMAIRSAEFGLPAAIGVGDYLYKKYMQSKVLELDPGNAIIRVIR